MNKKIFGVVFLAGILILVGAGCSRKAVVQDTAAPTAPAPGAEEEAKKPESEQPTAKTTGKIIDAQCIDVMAHKFWATILMQVRHDMPAFADMTSQAENLQKQYGISDDDFENICNAKVGGMEFMDQLEKRMKELGFVIE